MAATVVCFSVMALLVGACGGSPATPTSGSQGPPTAITRQPQSQTIASGTTATLSVTATGMAPLSYQWYIGPSPTTTHPIDGATASSYTTPALTSTMSYWVRVSNVFGGPNSISETNGTSADSTTATITVATPPTISTQPESQTIASGATAALSVTAMGTAPLSYQWYVGSMGTTTNPIAGATASSYTTPALTSTTSYWVRVSNVGGSADSTTVTITVIPKIPTSDPAITTQPQSQTITSGTTATLTVVATGTVPLSYQWYIGSSGTTTNPIAGATASNYTTPTLTNTTSYWVRVTNTINFADSTAATITVMTAPTAPTIATQPQSQTIPSGTTAALSVTASGTAPLSYQWYVGPSGTTTSPIAGATSSNYTTPALTSDTSYWVRVTNTVNRADSMTARITVTTAPAPTIRMFTANPTTITRGQSATLAWSGITNATTCSINNAVGTVSCSDGTTSVTPTTTTPYTFTATGTGGSATAMASVTVNPGSQTFTFSGAVQTFTVPAGVTAITITAAGAGGGGAGAGANNGSGGGGVSLTGSFIVSAGSRLSVIVAGGGGVGTGAGNGSSGGGGGGSFVFAASNALLIAAGGGGGGGETYPVCSDGGRANLTTSGSDGKSNGTNPPGGGGSAGNGGGAQTAPGFSGGGGGGFDSDGGSCCGATPATLGGGSLGSGFRGGRGACSNNCSGGFGGGGGGASIGGGGGGGGYSGGGGGLICGGGGGGSLNTGTNQSTGTGGSGGNLTSSGANGSVTITW